MKRIIITLLIITCFEAVYSQDTSITDFLPLAIGNVWVYNWHEYQPIPPIDNRGIYIVKLTGTFVANSKVFYSISRLGAGCSPGLPDIYNNQALSMDSVTGNIYAYTPGQGCSNSPDERMIDSLRMQLNDYLFINCHSNIIFCLDTTSRNLFGTMRQTKGIGTQGPESGSGDLFATGIGIFSFGSYLLNHSCSYGLKGCVINGIVYGDTGSVTGMHQISSEIPKSFSLYQNYPNPFNPQTKIKFGIPAPLNAPGSGKYGTSVALKIYDALGREVMVLVSESLKPGAYEVNFDGSNLPSGVYIYKIESNGFKDSKKMVLLK